MINPFRKIKVDGKTQAEKELQKKISNKCFDIAKKYPLGKCKPSDIEELECLYAEYQEKFPNIEKKISQDKLLKKLKLLVI